MVTIDRKHILRACYSFFIPVARFLLTSGISFREFIDIARVAFVNVASEDYGIRGRPTNISRVAAMTGIPRKDVKKVRLAAGNYMEDPRAQLSPLGDVLQQWCTNTDFSDLAGEPASLSFNGPSPSFEQLVQRAAGDVPPGAVKVELLRLGVIEECDAGLLRLTRREIVPKDIDERLLTAIAFSLRALAATIAFNTDPQRQSPARVERFVQSGSLTKESRQELSLVTRERLTRFTEEIDDLFSRGGIATASEGGRRIGVGVYYYEDPE